MDIRITVGLPLYRARHIGWLAIKSLYRQKVNVPWELIILEEQGNDDYGKDKVFSDAKLLGNAGCKRIIYSSLRKWVPLSYKIQKIIEKSSGTSRVFVYQSADCYSKPSRLQESFDLIFNQQYDYIASQIGPMYNIFTSQIFIYDVRNLVRKEVLTTAWNQAYNIGLLREIKPEWKDKGIDRWLITKAQKAKGGPLTFFYNNNPSWRYGTHTNGINNITTSRLQKRIHRERYKSPIKYKYNFYSCIPKDVVTQLQESKDYCRCGRSIPKWMEG
jgi:hypothetical protein